MDGNDLGRFQKIDLREVWKNEAGEFTPWLAEEENLLMLGEILGIELELEAQEKSVGPFRADILCKDTATNHWVLIENQLERTDHNHLGQLITYAAGLDAVTIVWVADVFTEEHRAALDWLNEITDASAHFFGLEVELWKIGDSKTAPKFNIVSKPNEWTKTVAAMALRAEAGGLTDTQELYLDFWTEFREYILQNGPGIKLQKPSTDAWSDMAIGRSYFVLRSFLSKMHDRVGMGLVLSGTDAKPHFFLLEQQRKSIEQDIGEELEWRELPERIESHILLNKHEANLQNRDSWQEHFAWLHLRLEAFDKAFRERVKKLSVSDYSISEELE